MRTYPEIERLKVAYHALPLLKKLLFPRKIGHKLSNYPENNTDPALAFRIITLIFSKNRFYQERIRSLQAFLDDGFVPFYNDLNKAALLTPANFSQLTAHDDIPLMIEAYHRLQAVGLLTGKDASTHFEALLNHSNRILFAQTIRWMSTIGFLNTPDAAVNYRAIQHTDIALAHYMLELLAHPAFLSEDTMPIDFLALVHHKNLQGIVTICKQLSEKGAAVIDIVKATLTRLLKHDNVSGMLHFIEALIQFNLLHGTTGYDLFRTAVERLELNDFTDAFYVMGEAGLLTEAHKQATLIALCNTKKNPLDIAKALVYLHQIPALNEMDLSIRSRILYHTDDPLGSAYLLNIIGSMGLIDLEKTGTQTIAIALNEQQPRYIASTLMILNEKDLSKVIDKQAMFQLVIKYRIQEHCICLCDLLMNTNWPKKIRRLLIQNVQTHGLQIIHNQSSLYRMHALGLLTNDKASNNFYAVLQCNTPYEIAGFLEYLSEMTPIAETDDCIQDHFDQFILLENKAFLTEQLAIAHQKGLFHGKSGFTNLRQLMNAHKNRFIGYKGLYDSGFWANAKSSQDVDLLSSERVTSTISE